MSNSDNAKLLIWLFVIVAAVAGIVAASEFYGVTSVTGLVEAVSTDQKANNALGMAINFALVVLVMIATKAVLNWIDTIRAERKADT
jgi:glucan phosphoethanolaminetransferase (alkaline phosphatase superfamily)